jgi:hypothetical protein
VSIELTYGEGLSLKHAAGVLELFVTQTRRGWSHPAVSSVWCKAAAERLVVLAESGRSTEGDQMTLYRTAATIAQAEPTGFDLILRDLLGIAMRLAPLEPSSTLGKRSRPSPLADK